LVRRERTIRIADSGDRNGEHNGEVRREQQDVHQHARASGKYYRFNIRRIQNVPAFLVNAS
jgi:hypothetical protein